MKNRNIRNCMLVFVYSTNHLKLSFPYLVVILTTLKTPKPNSLLTHNKFGCTCLYYIHRTTQLEYAELPGIFRLF